MIFGIRRPTGWPGTRRCRSADVQWVMGHAHLSTTQRYLNPLTEDVIEGVLAFHARRADRDRPRHRRPGYRAGEPAGAVRQGRGVNPAGRWRQLTLPRPAVRPG